MLEVIGAPVVRVTAAGLLLRISQTRVELDWELKGFVEARYQHACRLRGIESGMHSLLSWAWGQPRQGSAHSGRDDSNALHNRQLLASQ